MAEKFATGLTYREIGEALFIAPSTVRTHLAAIYEKFGVRNKVALAAYINRAPGVAPDEPSPLPDALPVLAIFPIECLNSEERWRRFADGSDISIDLARYADLPVIAFHTMKSLGSKPADFVADGKALGAGTTVCQPPCCPLCDFGRNVDRHVAADYPRIRSWP
ncbi:LuxR C-terminal-related transcriptional regulator [Mesorhizobium waimense]|uniref:LuxR C-terminal-related transcriptional regulator n=1 Tax=Mesorhizobium waimense TaxID=1300307 RepID=UPI001FE06CCA|nr:LuxR C-terminal-related transcriptional regulator [Mesorhizobium waimense]